MNIAAVTTKRDMKIDILRAIAIVCIIVAHSNPNSFVIQLRNFDVVLMVFLMGISFSLSSAGKQLKYADYVKARFSRLIIPTWVFITIFLALFYIIAAVRHDAYYFNFRVILGSYTLQDGIGYVWIMGVFFIVALISPVILASSKSIQSNLVYLFVILGGWLVYEMLLVLGRHLSGGIEKVYSNLILDGLGYGLVAALGIRFKELANNEQLYVGLFALVAFGTFGIYYNFAPTQDFKYPPQLYYFSYGIFVSVFIYKLLEIKIICDLFSNSIVSFLSKNSIWLYFWHIIFIYMIKLFGNEIDSIPNSFGSRFMFIFCGACLVTYLHTSIREAFISRKIQISI